MKYLDVPSSGSIADRTHSHNRAGQYTRNRRAPVQPVGSGRRAFIRGAFGGGSTAWSGLTDAQRAAWNAFASSHPVTDSLGQAITLTGHQMYVRLYVQAINVAGTPLTDPPTVLSQGSVFPVTFTIAAATGGSLAFSVQDGSGFVTIGYSRQLSPGRTFNKTFWEPKGGLNVAQDDTSPLALSKANYEAQFGTLVAGNRVFAKVNHFTSDFWLVESTIVSALVT